VCFFYLFFLFPKKKRKEKKKKKKKKKAHVPDKDLSVEKHNGHMSLKNFYNKLTFWSAGRFLPRKKNAAPLPVERRGIL
jgi:hypothetical protein